MYDLFHSMAGDSPSLMVYLYMLSDPDICRFAICGPRIFAVDKMRPASPFVALCFTYARFLQAQKTTSTSCVHNSSKTDLPPATHRAAVCTQKTSSTSRAHDLLRHSRPCVSRFHGLSWVQKISSVSCVHNTVR